MLPQQTATINNTVFCIGMTDQLDLDRTALAMSL